MMSIEDISVLVKGLKTRGIIRLTKRMISLFRVKNNGTPHYKNSMTKKSGPNTYHRYQLTAHLKYLLKFEILMFSLF